jgi:hypothetical protein
MIIRIMGEGQFDVAEGHVEELNRLDHDLLKAVDTGDEERFSNALQGLLASVRANATELPDDYLGPSDLVLPSPDATIDEVREILGEEGLIPG